MASTSMRGSGDAWRGALVKIREQLQCTVCLDTLTDPRILPCHHSFCLQCLRGLLPRRDGGVLTCPNCAKTLMLVGSVDDLPVDFKLSSLLEYLNAMEASNEPPVETKPALKVDESMVQGKIKCPVCETVLTEPRHLECGHTFCTSCIELMKPVREQDAMVISCPCCSSKTDVSNGVKSLPPDLEKLLYILTVMKAYHETGANKQVMAAILDIELSDDEQEPEPVREQTAEISATAQEDLVASQEIQIQISPNPGDSQPRMMNPVCQPPVIVQPSPTLTDTSHSRGGEGGPGNVCLKCLGGTGEACLSCLGCLVCLGGCCACCLCSPCIFLGSIISDCCSKCCSKCCDDD